MIAWMPVADGYEDGARLLEVSDADAHTIANALRIAAERYEGDAEQFASLATFADKRIAEQFRKQAAEARAFAEVLT